MVAFLVLSWLSPIWDAYLILTPSIWLDRYKRLLLFKIGGLSCGILCRCVNRTSSVVEGFTLSPFAIVRSDSILSLAVIRSQSVCGYFPLKMMATSSAYATTLQPPPSIILSSLFTAIFHRRGDSTPPCGVPLFTCLVWVEVPSVAVTILLNRNLWVNPTIGVSTPRSVRDSVIAVGSTLLKAPSISRKAISWLTFWLSVLCLWYLCLVYGGPYV